MRLIDPAICTVEQVKYDLALQEKYDELEGGYSLFRYGSNVSVISQSKHDRPRFS
jgi:hypothetical protein